MASATSRHIIRNNCRGEKISFTRQCIGLMYEKLVGGDDISFNMSVIGDSDTNKCSFGDITTPKPILDRSKSRATASVPSIIFSNK